jgi:hypothetical protein
MGETSVMDQLTTVGASAAVTSPLWLQSLNPYVQFLVAVLGCVWLGVQIYYKFKNGK